MRVRPDPCVAQVAAWIAEQGRELNLDCAQAERFLKALDPWAESFSFRTFSDTPYTRLPGRDPLERALHGPLATCWAQLVALNRRGAAVSVTVNRTNGQGRAEADITRVRALFMDDDQPPQNLDRFPLSPHIQIQTSPGRYHHYWLVEDLPLTRFKELQRRLAQHYHGDNRVMALNQSMQLPGFWRRKNPARPCLPSLEQISELPPYPADRLERLLGNADDAHHRRLALPIV